MIFTGCFIGILETLMHNCVMALDGWSGCFLNDHNLSCVMALDGWSGCFLNDHNLSIVSSFSRTLFVFTRYFITLFVIVMEGRSGCFLRESEGIGK